MLIESQNWVCRYGRPCYHFNHAVVEHEPDVNGFRNGLN
jgi:hypothetical protein